MIKDEKNQASQPYCLNCNGRSIFPSHVSITFLLAQKRRKKRQDDDEETFQIAVNICLSRV